MDTNISSIGTLITIALVTYWVICYFLGKSGLHKNPMVLSDNYQLGYFRNCRPQEPAVKIVIKKVAAPKEKVATPKKVVVKPKPVAKPKAVSKVVQQPKPTHAPVAKPSFYDECVQSLIVIGYKPNVAKQLTDGFFKKDTASNLEEFFVKINKR